jgi:hypothetical protein
MLGLSGDAEAALPLLVDASTGFMALADTGAADAERLVVRNIRPCCRA